ncbi:MAG: adenylate/guanylate cyclase domain-containing protein [Deltaproteobacteria bacterium]|nr:adenylate/guanylate cyclase domain-containing protein [Deltaproteobacteria bacterium]
MPTPDARELTGQLLALRQQVIDLKAQIDREHLMGEGFRRLGERVVEIKSVETFIGAVAEEVLSTFGTENVLVLRLQGGGATVCGSCCVDHVSAQEVARLAALVPLGTRHRAQVLTHDDLPTVQGRPSAVILVGTFLDRSDREAVYAVYATVSRAKATFYPKFGPELAPLYEAYLNHLGALQQHLREREAAMNLMRATQHFVPQEFLQALGHADVTTARLGDAVQRHVTILFADIRNFTSISEGLSPAETTAFLNDCPSRIGPEVRAHGGFVDKYIGDAIMALFPGSPGDAIRAAIAMQEALAAASLRAPSGAPVTVGIGVHAGPVMMCTVGEVERFEATVISDTVNVTARLESLTKQLGSGILTSTEVSSRLPPEMLRYARGLGRFTVKGKAVATEIVEVYACDPPVVRVAKDASRAAFASALASYRMGRVDEAVAEMSAVVAASSCDLAAQLWLAQTQGDLETGSPPGGSREVLRLDAK